MVKISRITMARLKNGAYYFYHTDILRAFKGNAKVKTKIGLLIVEYEAAINEVDEALKLPPLKVFRNDIAAENSNCGVMLTTLKACASASMRSDSAETKDAAEIVMKLVKNYGIKSGMQLENKIGLLENLVTDLNGKFKKQVDLLMLGYYVAKMKDSVEKIRQLVRLRNETNAEKQFGLMKKARAHVDAVYRQIITILNAAAVIEGDEDYIELFCFINSMITHFKRNALKQSAKQTSKNKTSTSTPGKKEPEVEDNAGNNGGDVENGTDNKNDVGNGTDNKNETGNSNSMEEAPSPLM